MKEQHTFLISVKYLWYALVVKKQFRITRTGGAHFAKFLGTLFFTEHFWTTASVGLTTITSKKAERIHFLLVSF